jgi:LCP family protein required for cell wall assembly
VRRTVIIGVVVLLIAVGYVAYNYQTFVSGITHVNALVPGGHADDKDENILLVGDDHRPAGASAAELAQLGTTQDGGGTQTDTMIVLHVPANGTDPTLISIPRDSWVMVPGVGMRKLNSVFEIGSATGGDAGGARLLIRVIQNLTGLSINHYVRISLLGFYSVVKALGPVTVCLNAAVRDPYSGINLPAGTSTLDAQQALAFVRQRHGLATGDLGREARQQYFLSIEARKILTAGTLLDPVKLQNVLRAVSSSIETDPGLNLLALAAQVKGFGGHLSSATIPILGTPTIVVDGSPVSIVEVDTAAMPAFIHGIITGKAVSTAPPAPTPAQITLTVLNGGHVNGAAAAASIAFDRLGFHTDQPATAPAIEAVTLVEYPAGDAAAAGVVARYLPDSRLVESAAVTQIRVILGTDGIRVDPSPTAATPTVTASPAPSRVVTTTYSAKSCIN